MMREWAKVLPFFIVVFIAKKYGERFYDERTKTRFVYPYKNVRLYLGEEK